jgi:hypothetical protein
MARPSASRRVSTATIRADDEELLVVLLSEHGQCRLHHVEELEHHRCHAAKVARPVRAAEVLGDRRRLDEELLGDRIELALVRREHHVDAERLELREVGSDRARVAVEILGRTELQAVHEDAHHHASAFGPGDTDQVQMSLVQIAHGRDERDAAFGGQVRTQRTHGGDHFHGRGG